MDRREALSLVSLICGGTIVGAGGFLSGCKESQQKSIIGILDIQSQTLVENLAETILPGSPTSPGALDVEIGKFINQIVSDCYAENEQKAFIEGVKKLDEISNIDSGKKFINLSASDKNALLIRLENESESYNKGKNARELPHYYSMMKQLIVLGYLSSELVATKVMQYVPIPGRFDGCVPYVDGEKAFT